MLLSSISAAFPIDSLPSEHNLSIGGFVEYFLIAMITE